MEPTLVLDRSEYAFTLVELIVVMIIVAVLASLGVLAMSGSKDAANRGKVLAVAQSYDQAMSSFASDHTGRIPIPGNATDWPELKKGPLEPSTSAITSARQPYLRSLPEAVSDGVIAVQTTSPSPGAALPAGTVGVVTVVSEPVATPTRYRIEIWAGAKGKVPATVTCYLGTLLPTGGKTC